MNIRSVMQSGNGGMTVDIGFSEREIMLLADDAESVPAMNDHERSLRSRILLTLELAAQTMKYSG